MHLSNGFLQIVIAGAGVVVAVLAAFFVRSNGAKALAVVLAVVCALMVAIGYSNEFGDQGQDGEGGFKAEPPVTTPNAGDLPPLVASSPDLERYNVGLNEWCNSVGGSRAVLDVAIESRGAVNAWHCLDGRAIDWPAACRFNYPNQATQPVMTNPDNAYSVKCKPT
jgi:hypothetical protein